MADFDLYELIAAPIIAMNEAEAQNAARYVDLLEDYAFEDKDGQRKLSTLAFSYARAEADGTASLQSVEIPLIQFLPISGVAIDQAKLNYALKINPVADKSPSGRLRMLGRLAENTESNSPLSGNINIELHLKQVDMPQGVLSLLETSQQAAQQKTISVEDPTPEPEPEIIIPDDFINFDVIETSADIVRPGQDVTYVLRPNFAEELRKQDTKVLVMLGAQPRAALEFEGEKDMTVRHGEDFKVRFLTSPRIEKYKPNTQIKLVLEAEAKSGTGIVKTKVQTISLPRRQTRPIIIKDIS
jgi:hypothetical protein